MADITYCFRNCANTDCKRNMKNLKKEAIHSFTFFQDCKDFKETKNEQR